MPLNIYYSPLQIVYYFFSFTIELFYYKRTKTSNNKYIYKTITCTQCNILKFLSMCCETEKKKKKNSQVVPTIIKSVYGAGLIYDIFTLHLFYYIYLNTHTYIYTEKRWWNTAKYFKCNDKRQKINCIDSQYQITLWICCENLFFLLYGDSFNYIRTLSWYNQLIELYCFVFSNWEQLLICNTIYILLDL